MIEVGDRLGKPVLATGNVHYIEPEEEIYREIIVRSLGQGAMINRTIGHGEHAQPAPLQRLIFERLMRCWMNLPFGRGTGS